MKGILLAVVVLLGLSGCGKEPPNQIKKLDGYTVIGYLDDRGKVITLYDSIGVVCIERALNSKVDYASAAFSCWDVDAAPAKIKGLMRDLDKK